MEEIIEKAIEGGYKLPDILEEYKATFIFGIPWYAHSVLDPLFWQALGKACGWTENGFWAKHQSEHGKDGIIQAQMPEWEFLALRFHEINLIKSWDKAVEYLKSIVVK